MVTITLQVPDQVAERIAPHRSDLPALLLQALELSAPNSNTTLSPQEHPLFDETLTLLTSRPTLSEIVSFKYSPHAQARLQELEDKNREESLDQVWREPFSLQGARIVGFTPVGRATSFLLRLNEARRLQQRVALMAIDRYPLGDIS